MAVTTETPMVNHNVSVFLQKLHSKIRNGSTMLWTKEESWRSGMLWLVLERPSAPE